MSRLLLLCLLLVPMASVHAATQPDLPDLPRLILEELNRVRTAPGDYAQRLDAFRKTFQGDAYFKPGSPVRFLTREGVAAVDEARTFLRAQSPLPPLQWSDKLTAAADELAAEQERDGSLGHGRGTSDMEQRLTRHGNWSIGYAENVGYGDYRVDDAGEVIVQMIVDDGVPGRGHRLNLFDVTYRLVGIACRPHPLRKMVCVIDFAGGDASAEVQ